MFPLEVVLVGVGPQLALALRRALLEQQAGLAAELNDVKAFLSAPRHLRAERRLLLVHVTSEQGLPPLRRLAAACPDWPLLALVERGAGPDAYLRANRAGATQVVALPLDGRDFAEALKCISLQCSPAARTGALVAVTGATGGCGTTTLAINLTHEAAAQHGQRCILAELAQRMGVLSTHLDVEPRITLPELLRELDRVDTHLVQQALTRVADTFDILAGPQELSSPSQVAAADIFQVLEYARQLADVVVLDVPCNYGDLQFEVLAGADQIVLVGEQTIPSVRALKLMRDSLRLDGGEPPLHLVLNRYDPALEGFTAADLQRVLQVPLVTTVAADPTAVKTAANRGRPLRAVAPHSPALRDIDALVLSALGLGAGPAPAPAEGSGLFTRLVKALRR
jgi:pilus assembly protein CpaE